MSRERRVHRRLWHLIVDDPYRKLVAIGLAVLLWFFIDSRIMDSEQRPLPLDAVTQAERGDFDQLALLVPPDIKVRRFLDGEREIDRVDLVLRGPRFRVDALRGQPLNLVVRKFQSRDLMRVGEDGQEQPVERLAFTVADIFRDRRELQGLELEMSPREVQVEFQRFENYSLTNPGAVTSFVASGFADERIRADTAAFTPATVTIFGPKVAIDRLRKRDALFRVELTQAGNDDRASGVLELVNGDALGVSFETRPSVQVELMPKREAADLDLPVLVDDLNLPPEQRGMFVPEKQTLRVRVSFSGALRNDFKVLGDERSKQEWAAANLRLVVYIAPLQPGALLGEEVVRQPNLMLAGTRRLQRYGNSEFKLEDSPAVTLRRTP